MVQSMGPGIETCVVETDELAREGQMDASIWCYKERSVGGKAVGRKNGVINIHVDGAAVRRKEQRQ